jgi:hypothetical protein
VKSMLFRLAASFTAAAALPLLADTYVYYPGGYNPQYTASVSGSSCMATELETRYYTSGESDGRCPVRAFVLIIR